MSFWVIYVDIIIFINFPTTKMFSRLYSKRNTKLCRICLKISENPLNIFGNIHVNSDKILKECLEEMCDIAISPEDNLPVSICAKCIEQLEQSYSFRMLAQQNDIILHKIVDGKKKTEPVTIIANSPGTELMNIEENSQCNDLSTNSIDECTEAVEHLYNHQARDYILENSFIVGDELAGDEFAAEHEIITEDEIMAEDEIIVDDGYIYNDDSREEVFQEIEETEISLEFPNSQKKKTKKKRQMKKKPRKQRARNLNKIYGCQFCGRKFAYLKTKDNHEDSHKCPICEKVINTSYHLSRHIYMHTNVKSFKCSKCDKQYITRAEMNRHLKTHEQLNYKFKCVYCNKSFHEIGVLNRHTSTVHFIERKHECNICGRRFISPCKVRLHQTSKICSKSSSVQSLTIKEEIKLEDSQCIQSMDSTSDQNYQENDIDNVCVDILDDHL